MILNRAERMLARRYLLPGKGEGFIFLVAAISLIAVALGVAALIIVMSVMNGFRAELFDKIVGLNGHAVVQGYDGRLSDWQQIADAAKKTPGVTSAVPLIEKPLMATANGRFEGVLVRGMRVEDIRANKTIIGNVRRRRHEVAHARQQQGRDRLAAGRHAGRLSRAARSRCGIPRAARPSSAPSRAKSPTPSARCSRSASTITTRRSCSCRCRTRRNCC